MADFSQHLPDPMEAARRRHGFSTPADLEALDRLVALGARSAGGAVLVLQDSGGIWYERAEGMLEGTLSEQAFSLDGADLQGLVKVAGDAPLASLLAEVIQDHLKARRLGADRRRNPRGPEGASFVPGVIHELRNLLFALGAGLDALEVRRGTDPSLAEHSEMQRKNLDRLQGFLEELNAYGNPGRLAFSLQPLAPVFAQAAALAQPLAQSRRVEIAVIPSSERLQERMDRGALEGAVRRLIEVVALETREEGTVSLVSTLLEGKGRPWVEVLLSGAPGRGRDLDPTRLFEPFHYRDRDMQRLGPAIARRVIEAHGGQVLAMLPAEGLQIRALLPVWKEGA